MLSKPEQRRPKHMNKHSELFRELSAIEEKVSAYILESVNDGGIIKPPFLEECVLNYVSRPGKKMRPAVLYMACEAVGGSGDNALAACAAVEIFHTWTLVHDDVIDDDDTRRGMSTVHKFAARYAESSLQLRPEVARKYGTDVAMLTGDIQHGWAISFLSSKLPKGKVAPAVVLSLITELQTHVLRTLVEGEMLDVDFGLIKTAEDLSDEMILDMLWKKTGVLYEFSGKAGAMVGQNTDVETVEVLALKQFCSLCGTAFQVVDDILGLVGSEAELGKPIGSDLREGKKTLLVREALRNANSVERATLLDVLGNRSATEEEIQQVTSMIVNLGGVEKARSVADSYVQAALPNLNRLPNTRSRDLLEEWAKFMIDRNR